MSTYREVGPPAPPEAKSALPQLYDETIERVIIGGDLSALSSGQRLAYYKKVCASVGLNPLTQPFQYITLNGKLVLYATKACTDQLRSVHDISVTKLDDITIKDVYVVTAQVQNNRGRTDMAKGAVALGALGGDALANALMKAETKAKRRATLSICGLSILDESELETVPHEPEDKTWVAKWGRRIAEAKTAEELKKEFTGAFKAARKENDKIAEKFFVKVKDERKAQLSQGLTSAASVLTETLKRSVDLEPPAEDESSESSGSTE